MPVSYTHLDVYKRQEYVKGKDPIVRLIQNRIAFRSETPKKSWLDFFKS